MHRILRVAMSDAPVSTTVRSHPSAPAAALGSEHQMRCSTARPHDRVHRRGAFRCGAWTPMLQ